jgi:hypothetical protein
LNSGYFSGIRAWFWPAVGTKKNRICRNSCSEEEAQLVLEGKKRWDVSSIVAGDFPSLLSYSSHDHLLEREPLFVISAGQIGRFPLAEGRISSFLLRVDIGGRVQHWFHFQGRVAYC